MVTTRKGNALSGNCTAGPARSGRADSRPHISGRGTSSLWSAGSLWSEGGGLRRAMGNVCGHACTCVAGTAWAMAACSVLLHHLTRQPLPLPGPLTHLSPKPCNAGQCVWGSQYRLPAATHTGPVNQSWTLKALKVEKGI